MSLIIAPLGKVDTTLIQRQHTSCFLQQMFTRGKTTLSMIHGFYHEAGSMALREASTNDHWHLGEQDFFTGLRPEDRQQFYVLSIRRDLQPDEPLFSRGDPACSCFYIETGIMRVHCSTSTGIGPMLFVRGKGELVGVAELVSREPRTCSARAMSPVVLQELSEKAFERYLLGSPVLARRMMEIMGQRIHYLNAQVRELMECSTAYRLLKLFVCLSRTDITRALPENRPVLLAVRLTQKEMAELTGSTARAVSTALRELHAKGLIRFHEQSVLLTDPAAILDGLGIVFHKQGKKTLQALTSGRFQPHSLPCALQEGAVH